MAKRITDRAVHAEAAALRVQVFVRPGIGRRASSTWASGCSGAAAVAPEPAAAPGPRRRTADPPATGGGLTVTGVQVGVAAATGVLLLAVGAALVCVAHRGRARFRAGPRLVSWEAGGRLLLGSCSARRTRADRPVVRDG